MHSLKGLWNVRHSPPRLHVSAANLLSNFENPLADDCWQGHHGHKTLRNVVLVNKMSLNADLLDLSSLFCCKLVSDQSEFRLNRVRTGKQAHTIYDEQASSLSGHSPIASARGKVFIPGVRGLLLPGHNHRCLGLQPRSKRPTNLCCHLRRRVPLHSYTSTVSRTLNPHRREIDRIPTDFVSAFRLHQTKQPHITTLPAPSTATRRIRTNPVAGSRPKR